MIDRYSLPEMASIWSEEAKYKSWLAVELASARAFAAMGQIPAKDVAAIEKNARIDLERIAEIEKSTRHDVIAFTRALSETLGDEKKWVHYGLTSTDVVDTAQALRLKDSSKLISTALDELLKITAARAKEHKYTTQIGRTHGVHAELYTAGLKFAYFYAELRRAKNRFSRAASAIAVGKISGAVGTYANVSPKIERLVCEELGLGVCEISTQILPRDLHAEYLFSIACIAAALERFATEIRHLAKTECAEWSEGFAPGQKGSSAMPHKRNPIGCENICGLARVLRSHLLTAMENINLWHERDISHSSAERMILPDSVGLIYYMLRRFSRIISALVIDPERCRLNLLDSYELIFSQQLLLALIGAGFSRENAYDLVQKIALECYEKRENFSAAIERNETICAALTPAERAQVFDTDYHKSGIDEIFARLNLD